MPLDIIATKQEKIDKLKNYIHKMQLYVDTMEVEYSKACQQIEKFRASLNKIRNMTMMQRIFNFIIDKVD